MQFEVLAQLISDKLVLLLAFAGINYVIHIHRNNDSNIIPFMLRAQNTAEDP